MTQIKTATGDLIKSGLRNLSRNLATVDGWEMRDTAFVVHYYDGTAPRNQQRCAFIYQETESEKSMIKKIKHQFKGLADR